MIKKTWNNLSRDDKGAIGILVELSILTVFIATLWVLRTNGVV